MRKYLNYPRVKGLVRRVFTFDAKIWRFQTVTPGKGALFCRNLCAEATCKHVVNNFTLNDWVQPVSETKCHFKVSTCANIILILTRG